MSNSVEQPVRGIFAIAIIIITTMLVISLFSEEVFSSWVSYLFMSCVPVQIVFGLVWKCEYPTFLANMKQPLKGVGFILIAAFGGCFIALLGITLVANGAMPPGPQLSIFMILFIVVMFWLVGVFQCWPVSSVFKNPLGVGLVLLSTGFVTAYLIFKFGANFKFMTAAPGYFAHMDGEGAFMAFDVLTFAVTTVALIMTCILFDFWPMVKMPSAQNKIVFILSSTLYILILSFAVRYFFVVILGMDQIIYMVLVPISFIFGAFIMLDLFEQRFFATKTQPLKGIFYFILSVIFGVIMYYLYRFLGPVISGKMISDDPGYQLDFWIANAMLAISFPLIVVYNAFLNHWPIRNLNSERE